MNKDTRKALERLEAALLQEETEKPELAEDPDDFLYGLLDDPADSLASTGPVIYNNFANGYGQQEDEPTKKSDSLNGLLFTAAALLVGIGAMLVYWVVRFL